VHNTLDLYNTKILTDRLEIIEVPILLEAFLCVCMYANDFVSVHI
jgi:hypothetical protein